MCFGVVRFNEMKKYIGGISYKTLSSTLKELEADQLVHREEYPQIPPKVEYSLTERGKISDSHSGPECATGESETDCNHRLKKRTGVVMDDSSPFIC